MKICREKPISKTKKNNKHRGQLWKWFLLLFASFYEFSSVLLLLTGAKKNLHWKKNLESWQKKTYTEKLDAQVLMQACASKYQWMRRPVHVVKP